MSTNYNLGDITEKFNEATKRLLEILDCCVTADNKAKFATVKKKITFMIDTDPVYILDSAGAYIYKYRVVITESEDSFSDFILNTGKYIYSDDSQAAEAKAKESSSDNVNFAKSMLEHLRIKWNIFSAPEKKQIRKIVLKLLSEYCKYQAYLLVKN